MTTKIEGYGDGVTMDIILYCTGLKDAKATTCRTGMSTPYRIASANEFRRAERLANPIGVCCGRRMFRKGNTTGKQERDQLRAGCKVQWEHVEHKLPYLINSAIP